MPGETRPSSRPNEQHVSGSPGRGAAPLSIVEVEDAIRGLRAEDYENFEKLKSYGIAPSSRRNYGYQWKRWELWAAGRNVSALPADSQLMMAYLGERFFTHGHRPATLRAAAAAISYFHRENKETDPCDDHEVKEALSASGRMDKRKQKQADALTQRVLWEIIPIACVPRTGRGRSMERPETARRRGRVDIAIIGLMRDCLLRVSEAANAAWSHIEPDSDGSGTLWIPESKTDQEGEGDVGYISSTTMTFLDAIREDAPSDTTICGIRPNQISYRIKRAAMEAGWGDDFSGHSPRVGMAVDLARAGMELPHLMNASRWKSPTMPALYIRREVAKRNAVARYYSLPQDGPPWSQFCDGHQDTANLTLKALHCTRR